ncbi:hypothetical protein ACSBR2_014861 [Camellia fascicularis]
MSWVSPESIPNLLVWWYGHNPKHLGKIIWEAIPLAVLWSLWLARNQKVFNHKDPIWKELVELVKIRVAIWSKQSVKSSYYSINDFISHWMA